MLRRVHLGWRIGRPRQEYFDPIVSNVANSYRLQEECDVLLGLKIGRAGPSQDMDQPGCLSL